MTANGFVKVVDKRGIASPYLSGLATSTDDTPARYGFKYQTMSTISQHFMAPTLSKSTTYLISARRVNEVRRHVDVGARSPFGPSPGPGKSS